MLVNVVYKLISGIPVLVTADWLIPSLVTVDFLDSCA